MSRKLKIFVSGSWIERSDAKRVMNVLESNGFEIAEDWTVHSGTDGQSYSRRDRLGVFQCDVYVLNNPKTVSKGKFVELGMAIALRKPIIVIGYPNIGIFENLGVAIHVHSVENIVALINAGLPDLYKDAPRYTLCCAKCKHIISLTYAGETGIVDCPKCATPFFSVYFESGKQYQYVREEDTPGVEKTIRVEEPIGKTSEEEKAKRWNQVDEGGGL